MKINKLIDAYEDDSFSLYQLQKQRLLEGIILDYSFLKINPFKGISRKNSCMIVEEDRADAGLFAFLFNTNFFSIINPDVKMAFFDKIALFTDEFYEIKLISGPYSSKTLDSKIKDLIDSDFFDDEELVINLIKHKNIKIFFKLKEQGDNRKIIESKISLENADVFAESVLRNFIKKVSDRQLERDLSVKKYLNLLKVSYSDSDSVDFLIKKFKNLNLAQIRIKKDTLYMSLLFNNASGYSVNINRDLQEIINKSDRKYEEIKKEMKILDYKLREKFITIKDNHSI